MSFRRVKASDFDLGYKKVKKYFEGTLTAKAFSRESILNVVTLWAMDHADDPEMGARFRHPKEECDVRKETDGR